MRIDRLIAVRIVARGIVAALSAVGAGLVACDRPILEPTEGGYSPRMEAPAAADTAAPADSVAPGDTAAPSDTVAPADTAAP